MKHETLVNAITEIDDDLINDAHNVPAAKIIHWQRWCAAAACFLLIIAAAFLYFPKGDTIITVLDKQLTSRPLVISESNAVAAARRRNQEQAAQFSASLNIDVANNTNISVSSGTMQVFDSETSTLIYEGVNLETENDVFIIWTVEASEQITRFEMSLANQKTTDKVILSYSNNQKWIINKTTK